MPTLVDAMAEIMAIVTAVEGVAVSPDNPTEQIDTSEPQCVIYPVSSVSNRAPNNIQTDLHNIVVAIVFPISTYNLVRKTLHPLFEPITKALFQWNEEHLGTSNVDTFGEISVVWAVVDWGGLETYQMEITLNDVKIQNQY